MLKQGSILAFAIVVILLLPGCVARPAGQGGISPVVAEFAHGRASETTCRKFVDSVWKAEQYNSPDDFLSVPAAMTAGYIAYRQGSDLIGIDDITRSAKGFGDYCDKYPDKTLADYAETIKDKAPVEAEYSLHILRRPCRTLIGQGSDKKGILTTTITMNWLAGHADWEMANFQDFINRLTIFCARNPSAPIGKFMSLLKSQGRM